MVAGISFLEAPIKFQAPGITIGLGLGIGRLVFAALNKIVWLFAIVWLVAAFATRSNYRDLIIPLIMIGILLLQTCWLLPALDVRASQIIAGVQPASSPLHLYYIAADVAKLILLLGTGAISVSNMVKRVDPIS
jgi:hypothetical protein